MEKASEILKVLLNDEQLEDAGMYSSFFNGWKEIVGDKAAHSRITDIVRNAVIIEVDHPGWMQLIKMDEQRILKIMRERYPQLEIRSLRYVLGRRSGDPVLKTDDPESMPGEEKVPVKFSGVEEIEDPHLKFLLNKLGKAIEKRDKTR